MWPGFDSQTRHHMWVEFVVGSCPCSERSFSGYSSFPLSSKTNISNLDCCQAPYHEPLAREIVQALSELLTLHCIQGKLFHGIMGEKTTRETPSHYFFLSHHPLSYTLKFSKTIIYLLLSFFIIIHKVTYLVI